MRNVMCLVLGGGKGTRLFPLTQYRSKPAVPLAGKYRIIDIPISNCINSGLNRIYLLTQFNSVSLHRHIRQTYLFDRFDGGFVEILAAQQTLGGEDWYQGTADAVRKNLRYMQQPGIEYVLILSGDQLYRMDYRDMLATHQESNADATIATVPVSAEQAAAFGILQFDDSGRVIGFREKPKTEEELGPVRTDPAWIDAHGIASRGRDCLANMGIYLFNRDVLIDLLEKTDYEDFGKQIFPASIETHRVQVHLFDGYWEDIGTIKSYYEANLALAQPDPPFRFVTKDAPIYTRARFLPPTRIEGATIRNSLVADGCTIEEGAIIENSVIGLRCRIHKDVQIRNSIVMGADYYQSPEREAEDLTLQRPHVAIGRGTRIDGAIIDKNCRIGRNVCIQPSAEMPADAEFGEVLVRDGVIVVPKETTLHDGWKL
jgi:glucose-1-phosphate adenylyltransferase